jgi:putative transcriptional regulator
VTKAFDMILDGLDEVEAYLAGEREGYVTHIPDVVDVKAIRAGLKLSQARFAETFGFSLGRIRDWEQRRFEVDAPSRVYLTVIQREPEAVLRALAPPSARHPRAGAAIAGRKPARRGAAARSTR